MEIIGVRFKDAGRIYYFDPNNEHISTDNYVIVETARGIEYGKVEIENRDVNSNEITLPLKKVIRVATTEDSHTKKRIEQKQIEAIDICNEKSRKHNLVMKIIDVEITFDESKIIFYFTADGRIDFRELVKELASIFRMRIELRQIGVRDEAKILNSIGICGRPLCCSTFLGEFHPVSIKMAKDQNLSLNPTKISGACGRLMCCLKYEEETYEYLNEKLPNEGDIIMTPDGKGEVVSVSVLRQMVKALVNKKDADEKINGFYSVDEISVVKAKRHKESKKDIIEEME